MCAVERRATNPAVIGRTAVPSTRRPGHLAASEQVDMQVGYALAGVGAGVDYEAVAVHEAELLRHSARRHDQVAEEGFVRLGGLVRPT